MSPEAAFMNAQFFRLDVSACNVYITNQSQTTFARGVNSKEENSSDFCPNYVQEFGLSTETFQKIGRHPYRMKTC
jgi:hypothetical protein